MRSFLRCCALLVCMAGALQAQTITTVASGLDNPRGIAFSPNGALYVAEAGRGGSGPCVAGPEGGQTCYGATGAVTRIWKGAQERVLSGLPSHAAPDGSQAIGPHDISFQGQGQAYVTIGLGFNPADRPFGQYGSSFGKLIRFNPSNKIQRVVEISNYEAANNPAGGPLDSDPYGVYAFSGGQLVADAGANAVLWVSPNRRISTLAVIPGGMAPLPFPPFSTVPYESVPTAVAIGPDNAIYVGQLTGFPFPVGGANVYRVTPGGTPTVYASGFTNIIDLTWGKDGALYVLEIAAHSILSGDGVGALYRVTNNGATKTLVTDKLFWPGGVAIGNDGSFYVTTCSVCAGGGQVVRVQP